MVDRARRLAIVPMQTASTAQVLDVLVDELSPERVAMAADELRHLSHAIQNLPEACREVMWLRRAQELPQKEVAAQLGVREKTVEKHVANGVQLLAAYMRRLQSIA